MQFVINQNSLIAIDTTGVRLLDRSNNPVLFYAIAEEARLGNLDEVEFLDQILQDRLNSARDFLIYSAKAGLGIFKKRIEEYSNRNLPVEPLINFLSRLQSEEILSNEKFLAKIGTKSLPLTWDGNLIAYQRASMFNHRGLLEAGIDHSHGFSPLQIVNIPQMVGDFDFVVNRCPDTGAVYEVIVQPEQIECFVLDGFRVTGVQYLDEMEARITQKNKSPDEIVYYYLDEFDPQLVLRRPYDLKTKQALLEQIWHQPLKSAAKQTQPVSAF